MLFDPINIRIYYHNLLNMEGFFHSLTVSDKRRPTDRVASVLSSVMSSSFLFLPGVSYGQVKAQRIVPFPLLICSGVLDKPVENYLINFLKVGDPGMQAYHEFSYPSMHPKPQLDIIQLKCRFRIRKTFPGPLRVSNTSKYKKVGC